MMEITVFCAVWHKDALRHGLLAAHRENLRRQSVPVRALYVFDGGDTPPADLDAERVCSSENLTIYQAWNLALAAVRTPLVMNLNLDDRLAPDAAAKLAGELARGRAALVGGDWRICYSQDETDAVTPCFPAEELPAFTSWPPAAGTPARLGSGTRAGTMGCATMWKMDTHVQVPRYPWRLGDGTPVQAIGDGLFWKVLEAKGFTLARLPLVIGNYHSHPGDQAEFRTDNNAEWRLSSQRGISLF